MCCCSVCVCVCVVVVVCVVFLLYLSPFLPSLPVSLPNAYIRTGVHEQERLLALKLKNKKKC